MIAAVLSAAPLFVPCLQSAAQTGPAQTEVLQIEPYALGDREMADLADQATVRLRGSLRFVADIPTAEKVLKALGRPIPDHLLGVLRAPDAPEGQHSMSWGTVRWVPDDTIEPDEALAWTAEDMLESLRQSVEQANADHSATPPLEVRGWVNPLRYDPELHQLSWAASIVPRGNPPKATGPVVYEGIAFGRDGYLEIAMTSTAEHAARMRAVVDDLLASTVFKPGKTVDPLDVRPKVQNGVAKAMGIPAFRKAPAAEPATFADAWVSLVAAAVALCSILALVLYAYRHYRRDARRL